MDYTGIPTPSSEQLLFVMANQSPLVRERLERELYRTTADSDGSTDRYVVEDAFQQLLIDLSNIGLTLSADITDYTDNWRKMGQLLELTAYLLPTTLYPLLRSRSSLRQLLQHCLDGSLGSGETLIQTYLSELGGLDGQLPLVGHLTEIIDETYPLLVQSDLFTDCMRNQIALLGEEAIHPSIDEARHAQYQTFLRDLIGRMADAVEQFVHYPFYPDLTQLQNSFIQDLLAPVNTVAYSYLFLENSDSLPEEVQLHHAAKHHHYEVSHPWCFAYYQVRKLVPTKVQLAAMACYAYAYRGLTQDAYTAALAPLRESYPDPGTDAQIHSLYATTV